MNSLNSFASSIEALDAVGVGRMVDNLAEGSLERTATTDEMLFETMLPKVIYKF